DAADRGGCGPRWRAPASAEDVSPGAATGVRARRRAPLRLRPRELAPRPDGPPVRTPRQHAGHPDHDPLLRGQARRPVRDHARVRTRALRASSRSGARTDAAGVGGVARDARVAEPDVGEPRRPLAAVLAVLLPAAGG